MLNRGQTSLFGKSTIFRMLTIVVVFGQKKKTIVVV